MIKLKNKVREVISSVLPIICVVFLLSITVIPMPMDTILPLACSTVMLIIGMGLFFLDADMFMILMGEGIGTMLGMSKERCLTACITFVIGFIITVAESGLTVLVHQVPGIPNGTLTQIIAVGIGFFLVMALLKILFHQNSKYLLILSYALVFMFTYFSMDTSMIVAFDSGGVTTSPITVPFLMVLGIDTANVTQKYVEEGSFGITVPCSIGPILVVLPLGTPYEPQGTTCTPFEMAYMETSRDVAWTFLTGLSHYMWEVSKTPLPILCFFLLFQPTSSYFSKRAIIKILVGALHIFLSLILLLCGVNVGLISAGCFIGTQIVALPYNWILIPIGVLIGFFIAEAGPAIHTFTRQMEDISSSTMSTKAMLYFFSTGAGISLGTAMLRTLSCISIMIFLIPGYLTAIILSFSVFSVSTGIVFDSGDIVSDPVTATFLLPFTMGACEQLGGNTLLDALDVAAMVAMTPFLTTQILGFVMTKHKRIAAGELQKDNTVEFEEVVNERTGN